MKAYVGQTSDPVFMAELRAAAVGETVTRGQGEFPPKRTPWFFDNGAWIDHSRGRMFDFDAWEKELDCVAAHDVAPDFVVVPDVVAGGVESLRVSERWVGRVADAGLVPYLVLQDGMSESDVVVAMQPFAGLFVGGSLPWKMRTAARWCDFGHEHERPVHIGRVGTGRRVTWAREIGADSIDSSLPLWSRDKMRIFLNALSRPDEQARFW